MLLGPHGVNYLRVDEDRPMGPIILVDAMINRKHQISSILFFRSWDNEKVLPTGC